MLLPGFGWTGIDFWRFIVPIVDDPRFRCEVIDIEILNIQENGTPVIGPPPVTISGMDGADYLINVDITKC